MTRLTGGSPARRTARRTCSFALLVALGVALLSAAPVSAAPPPDRGGEVLGRATRSTAPTSPAVTAAVPSGFSDNLVVGGLTLPTAIAFAPGGKVFVGEKGGIVKVFDSPSDTSATQVVDLRSRVQDFWDRGLLGLAVDPGFGSAGHNFIYVLYTHDFNPEGSPTSWRRLPHPAGTHHRRLPGHRQPLPDPG
jgi:glucose/arabinose dehydrogenase